MLLVETHSLLGGKVSEVIVHVLSRRARVERVSDHVYVRTVVDVCGPCVYAVFGVCSPSPWFCYRTQARLHPGAPSTPDYVLSILSCYH